MATFVIFIMVMTSKLIKLYTLNIMQFLVPKCYLSKVVKKIRETNSEIKKKPTDRKLAPRHL